VSQGFASHRRHNRGSTFRPQREKSAVAVVSQKQNSERESELDASEKRVQRYIEERMRHSQVRGRRVWHLQP
jgi:hypothetical protein